MAIRITGSTITISRGDDEVIPFTATGDLLDPKDILTFALKKDGEVILEKSFTGYDTEDLPVPLSREETAQLLGKYEYDVSVVFFATGKRRTYDFLQTLIFAEVGHNV